MNPLLQLYDTQEALIAALELLGHRRFEGSEYNEVRRMFHDELRKVEREIEEVKRESS